VYRFTIVRPDRAVVVEARSIQQLVDRLHRWTSLELDLCRQLAPRVWRGFVVCAEDHAVLRGVVPLD
jgi:hypothetical protein